MRRPRESEENITVPHGDVVMPIRKERSAIKKSKILREIRDLQIRVLRKHHRPR
jgi:hypothetical protein